MRFEFDPAKSSSNRLKHGIDFIDAQELWSDDYLLLAATVSLEEPRFLAIGKIKQQFWTAIFTLRFGLIRIISVRRSRKEEIGYYESN